MKLLTGWRVLKSLKKPLNHINIQNEENKEIPNLDITLNNSSDLLNLSLQTIIRESSGKSV